MRDAATLCGLAEAEIDDLLADGATLTPADIVRLNALAREVESPESRRLLSRGIPVFVGGATLWPLTLAAHEWMDRALPAMPSDRLKTAALAYAMAYGRSERGLDHDGAEAKRAVQRWLGRLRCTWGELQVAMAQIIEQDERPDTPEKPAHLPPDIGDGRALSVGELSAVLASTAGGTPDYWERQCSTSYCFQMISVIVRQNAADGKPLHDDTRLLAEMALGKAIEEIRNRGKTDG